MPTPLATRFKTANEVKAAIRDRLSTLKHGMGEETLPREYTKMIEALKAHVGEPGVKEILELVPDVMGALRNPDLYAEVIADAWSRAIMRPTGGVNGALLDMASELGVATKVVPKGDILAADFFERYAGQPVHFVDTGFLNPDPHGGLTHLLQDLVVTLGLKAKGYTSAEFRALLNRVEVNVKLPVDIARDGPRIAKPEVTDLSGG